MHHLKQKCNSHSPIKLVIFDWAGTTVDYGCFAPLIPFINAFKKYHLKLTTAQARGPMGMLKIDHIKTLFQLDSIKQQFLAHYKRDVTNKDINLIYQEFEQQVFAVIPEFTTPIPNVVTVINQIQAMGIHIGSTTGYTKEMMQIVAPLATNQGYTPEYIITSSEVVCGRPYPYMIFYNMMHFKIQNSYAVIKVGDTIVDIKEGLNANCISIGIIEGSSELGLSLEEFNLLNLQEKTAKCQEVRYKMYQAGAHFVLDNIIELPMLLNSLNSRNSLNN